MHSRLLSRIIAVAGCIVILGVSLLLGTQLRFSQSGWERIIASISGSGWADSGEISLSLDAYDNDTEEIRVSFTGQATSPNAGLSVTAYRCNDIGQVNSPDPVGTLGQITSAYPATLSGDRFATPDIHLIDGDNYYLIVATDATGRAAKQLAYIHYSLGSVVPVDMDQVEVNDQGVQYTVNQIIMTFKPDTSMERAREIIAEIGGTELGCISVLKRFQVQVPPMSYDEIKAQGQGYVERYAELRSATPELVDVSRSNAEGTALRTDADASGTLPNDPWSSDPEAGAATWDENLPDGTNWNLEAIQAPSAWAYLPYFRSFTVGVIDTGFVDGHDDLRLYYPDERRTVDAHGAHIAGVIGATPNNGVGIAGVMNKGRVLAYPLVAQVNDDGSFVTSGSEKLMSLATCVTNGASVISCSLGQYGILGNDPAEKEYELMECAAFSETMAALLATGYDFVVAQAAGNGDEHGNAIDAINTGWFTYVRALENPDMAELAAALEQNYGISADDLLGRVIVVGNAKNVSGATPAFQLSNSSNCGNYVDIAAPGTDILSTVPGGLLGMGTYEEMSGTSMATPHVAAVAAMAWSTNPDITGKDVKKILVENYRYRAASTADSAMPGYEYPLVNAYLAVKAALAFERIETMAQIQTVDAATGSPIPVSIQVYRGVAAGGALAGTYQTDSNGRVTMELDSGDYLLDISAAGYITQPAAALHLDAGVTSSATYALSRELGENEFRVVLTWGSSPADLDSHLVGMDNDGNPLHVFYSNASHMSSSGLYAGLDVDDTSAFGPETITLTQMPATPLVYALHDFTNKSSSQTTEMSRSGATVQVMRHNEVLKTYTISPNHNAVVWNVFRLMPDGTLEDIDTYQQGPVSADRVGLDVR